MTCILDISCKHRCPCRHIWGLRNDVKDNLHVIADTTIIYPAGHNIVIRNLETQQQQFIQPPLDSEGILGLTLAPNQRHVAVTERAERATVTIYDLQTLKRRKVLSSVDISGKVRVLMPQSSWDSPVMRRCLSGSYQGGYPYQVGSGTLTALLVLHAGDHKCGLQRRQQAPSGARRGTRLEPSPVAMGEVKVACKHQDQQPGRSAHDTGVPNLSCLGSMVWVGWWAGSKVTQGAGCS